ncbi:hypothetical protein JOB18_033475 [Solea senegalensis]|uniref:Tubulin epsilon and delta complex protein 1 domain-containing protein n=1 Tax=Solea senegalensis TaxID=28829 RepID=A0AAV6S097_SOLSE|nr:tubulin epsilon and delta complex protein 1 isoform X1 [Solea senegalensis]KAG7510847.1 hypothetical protein JOB18_033475 [Solea senegalensis]
MQRRKASVNVEVKQVIGTLCRLLTATGLDAVPTPETFRRAKFGGGLEVEGQFWQLLTNILQRTGVISFEAGGQPRGDSEHRKAVAAGLRQTGCHADWTYGRQTGEEEEGKSFSGRDLLLALGWLLATGTLEALLTQRVQQLDKLLLTPLPVVSLVSSELQFDSSSLRRLQWLVGCLRHQRRILLSMLEERTRKLHTICSASLSPTASSSSNQSSTALKEDCDRLRQLCDLLEAYLNWKPVENVFWTWMDSVMDCHQTPSFAKESLHTPSVCQHNSQRPEKCEDMLMRLPTAQTCRVRLQGKGPVRDHSYTAENFQGSVEPSDILPASQASQLLLQTEALLLQKRDRLRLENRLRLQEVIGELEGLVLIPP